MGCLVISVDNPKQVQAEIRTMHVCIWIFSRNQKRDIFGRSAEILTQTWKSNILQTVLGRPLVDFPEFRDSAFSTMVGWP